MAEAEKENKAGSWDTTLVFAGVIATGAALLVIIAWVIYMSFRNGGAGNFASVATLILVGLAAFIGIMNILSLTANWLKMVDPKQPFGLPEGTVRAILTMAFIVLVGVLTSYMLSNSQRPPFSKDSLTVATGIPPSAATVLEQKFSAEGVVVVIDEVPASARTAAETAAKEAAAAGKPAPPPIVETRTVRFYPRIDYRQSDEVAKQILTILSTILAAMIGFYFGAKPGESSSTPKTDDRAALLAHFNAAKTKEPTIKTVSGNINDVANKETQAALQEKLDDISAKVKAADDALANPGATIETIRTSVTDAEAALGTLGALNDDVTKAAKPDSPPQAPNDKTTLLKVLAAAKEKEPTLAAVSSKIDGVANQESKSAFQKDLAAIVEKVDAADKVLADPNATIETARNSVDTAKAALATMAGLKERVDQASQ